MKSLLSLCVLLSLVLPSRVAAEDSANEVDSLVVHYQDVVDRARSLTRERAALSGEDSLVVVLQTENEVQEAAQTLQRLASVLVERGEAPPLEASIAAEYRELVSELWGGEDRVSERLSRTRDRIFRSEGRERIRLERELALRERRLSHVHRYLQETLDAMARLGLSVEEDQTRLIARVDERATELVGRIELVDQELEMVEEILKIRPQDTDFEQDLGMWRRRSKLYVEALESSVARLRAMGQPTTRYQNVLVTHTGEFARGLLDAEVAASLAREWWAQASDWLSENGVQIVLRAIVFLLVMAVAWGAARVVRRAVKRALDGPRVRVSHLLRKMLIDVSGNLVLLAGVLLGLSQVGANLAPILAGVGVVGFIVGFALQETLANFAAGIMILFYRPYDVGDFVEVSGVFGKVDQMSLVSTTILTIDNQTLVVPNGKIWGDVIRNVTAQRIRRVDLEFGISYSSDVPAAEEVLMDILKSHERVLADPEPMVRLFRLNDSSVDFIVRPWVKTDDYWDVYWDITREVKLRFDAAGIQIPFPQRDVHHYVGSTPAAPAMVPGPDAGSSGSHGAGAEDPTDAADET